MLILVDVNRNKARGQIEYQDRIVIDLDRDFDRGVKDAGLLFDIIFESAKKHVGLDRFGRDVRVYYIKGNAIKYLTEVFRLEGIEVVEDIVGCYSRFRIKRQK